MRSMDGTGTIYVVKAGSMWFYNWLWRPDGDSTSFS